jgi:hypothetical protein
MDVKWDETGWPIVEVVWGDTLPHSDIGLVLTRLDRFLARGERFGLLIDARGAPGLSPEQRNQVVAHMKQNAALTAKLLVQATAIDNLIQRTLFFGVNLLFPNPFPSKVFGDVSAAREWLKATIGVR